MNNKVQLKCKFIVMFSFILLFLTLPSGVFAAGKTIVKWLGHAGFEITTPRENVILIDPWLNNPMGPEEGFKIDKADIILVTHGHFDHFGDTAEIIKKTGALLCTIYEIGALAVNKMGIPKDKATFKTLMNIGGKISVLEGEVEIAMVQATHSSGIIYKTALNKNEEGKEEEGMKEEEKKIEEKEKFEMLYGGASVGFIITIKDGPTIYHTGDTGLFGDMRLIRQIYHPNLLLVPIGDHFTMGPELAAHAVKMVNPRWVIPMHYDTFPILTGRPEKFKNEVLKLRLKSEIVVLSPGEAKDF